MRNSNVVSMEKLPFFIHGMSITDQAATSNVGVGQRLQFTESAAGMTPLRGETDRHCPSLGGEGLPEDALQCPRHRGVDLSRIREDLEGFGGRPPKDPRHLPCGEGSRFGRCRHPVGNLRTDGNRSTASDCICLGIAYGKSSSTLANGFFRSEAALAFSRITIPGSKRLLSAM